MASLREVRAAIAADMRADGKDLSEVLAYRDGFKQGLRIARYKACSYGTKDRVTVVNWFPGFSTR